MKIATYTNYFRQLAVSHKDLQHNPLSETGDGPLNSQRFARFSAEDVVTGLSTKVNFPALLIENYEVKTATTDSSYVGEYYFGAFSIFVSANPKIAKEVEDAFTLAENIMQDCLQKIYQDNFEVDPAECNPASQIFGHFDFDGIDIMPVGPVFTKEFGYRCSFKFRSKNDNSLTQPPAPGTFL